MGKKIKKIGVKYCGGCNPTYERVEIIRKIRSKLEDQILFLRYDEPGVDGLVLMSGCHRACANQDVNPTGIPHGSAIGENDFENLMDWLTSLDEKGDPQ